MSFKFQEIKAAEEGIYVFRDQKTNKLLGTQEYKSHSKALQAACDLAAFLKVDIVFWSRNLVQKDYAYFTGYAREADDRPMTGGM